MILSPGIMQAEKKNRGGKMRSKLLVVAAFALSAVVAVPAAALAGTGNGAPSGPHFNLNIHGVTNTNGMSYSGQNKNDIFVNLTGKCTIDLTKGTPFEVLSPDCTKGSPARFQLPTPCTTTTTCTTFAYQVWVRALTPKGHATMSACVTLTTGTRYCNTNVVSLSKSNKTFNNVTNTLLSVCVTVTGTFKYEPLFATANANYFWQYTNYGLRLAQFRFYPITQSSNVGTLCTAKGPSSR